MLVRSQKEILRFCLATGEYLEQRQGVGPSTAVDEVLALGAICSYYSESIEWACDRPSVLFQWELGHVLVAEALVFFKMQSIPLNPCSGDWEHRW